MTETEAEERNVTPGNQDQSSGEGAAAAGDQEAGEGDSRRFGTFNGVFRPTILTILGVMMYLREGWIVGNAGLLGALGIIGLSYLITGTTALSISSITTNIRVGSGGVFSIISQSLGLEVGGSIGIPLYLAQGLSAAMYMHGFIESWMYVFPEHPRMLVLLLLFGVCFSLSYISAKLALRVQIVVMAGVVAALVSMALAVRQGTVVRNPVLIGDFQDGGFWMLFAIWFPAATGIMVGSSLSGNLKNPRRSIPLGTLLAWGVSGLVYVLVAVWYAYMGRPEELRNLDHFLAAERAFWGPAIYLGVMSSCFSATLSSMVAAPRVLQALGSHGVLPRSDFFKQQKNGEPRHAIFSTGVLVLVVLLLGDLNAIAKILTMFFLMAYFSINLVMVLESSLKMISFRPTFRVPLAVPLVGSISCLFAVVIINPVAGLISIMFCVGLYVYLDRKRLDTPWETVHSGLFGSIALWAARRVHVVDRRASKRSWKPDLLVPIERETQLEGYYRFLCAIIRSQGSIEVAGFSGQKNHRFSRLPLLIEAFRSENLFASYAIINGSDFRASLNTCISILRGSFFRPNMIFTSVHAHSQEELQFIVDQGLSNQMGVMLLGLHPETGFGKERSVNLWVRDQSPDWTLGLKLANLDGAVLLSYQLRRNWGAKLRLLTVIEKEENVSQARAYLEELMVQARMAGNIEIQVAQGRFMEFLDQAPRADLDIFGLSHQIDKDGLMLLVEKTGSTCLFVLDSGAESALA